MKFYFLLGFIAFSLNFSIALGAGESTLDGKKIKNKEELHKILSKELNFPVNYKQNLNSMYDILSNDYKGDNIIKIRHLTLLKLKLGSEYVESFMQSLLNASEDNSHIILVVD